MEFLLIFFLGGHAAYFSVFENMKHILQANGPGHTPLAAGLAGVAATISHDLIMTPMDVRKKQENVEYSILTLMACRW